ncbi:hypothetical protein LTR85_012143 [Meristemomyces frigidus]|nr:hypothetical protein LTR85_012143 [Meristemomyces frigidus]
MHIQQTNFHADVDAAIEEVFNILMLKRHISQLVNWQPFNWTQVEHIQEEDKKTGYDNGVEAQRDAYWVMLVGMN